MGLRRVSRSSVLNLASILNIKVEENGAYVKINNRNYKSVQAYNYLYRIKRGWV